MVRPIIRSKLIFAKPAADATVADAPIARDLLDTLAAHAHECVGLAANMVGASKRIIAFDGDGTPRVMFNPAVVATSGPYRAEESCLSLTGARIAQRFDRIVVEYQLIEDGELVAKRERFSGFTAQIIQHEVDHTNGICI